MRQPVRTWCGLFSIDLRMYQVSHQPIKLGAVRAPKHHRQVIAFLPVSLGTQLPFDALVELCAGQRVGNTDTDIIRPRQIHQSARGKDILEEFADVAKLNKESNPYPFGLQALSGGQYFRYGRALVHFIKNSLAAALGSKPRLAAPGLSQRMRHAQAD